MSTMKIAFAAVAALGLLAGAAYAKTDVSAKLAVAQPAHSRVIASGVIWNCEGDSCTAKLERAPTARNCMDLAGKVGQVVSFGGLNEADLARCNARAAAVAPATAVAKN